VAFVVLVLTIDGLASTCHAADPLGGLAFADVTVRNSEYLGASAVVGYDLGFTGLDLLAKVAVAARGGVALGGASGSLELLGYTNCPHGLPLCVQAGASAKVLRPWWISNWDRTLYWGGEATVGFMLCKATFGVFRGQDSGDVQYQLGLGVGL
jgi:hypothetical protein